jgi:hypothetical protein
MDEEDKNSEVKAVLTGVYVIMGAIIAIGIAGLFVLIALVL